MQRRTKKINVLLMNNHHRHHNFKDLLPLGAAVVMGALSRHLVHASARVEPKTDL